MPDAPPSPQFWLLTGEVPTGPFSVDQVHARIATGDATWQTLACPVGGGDWLPVVQTAGIGPSAPPRTGAGTRPPDAHPPSAPVASAPPADAPAPAGNLEGVFAAKSPAPTNRSTSSPDTTSSASPVAPIIARQESPPQASAGSPQPTAEVHGNSPSQPNQPNRFWLLVGTKTTGPFRAAHIRGMLQTGELAPDAQARRVGTEIWVPLTEAVGTLPPPTSPPESSSPTPPNQSNRFWLLVGTETTGPFQGEHIRGMLRSGKLPPDAKARRVGTEIWVPLTEAVGPLPPVPSAPEPKSFLHTIGVTPQMIHVGIGLLLTAGLLAAAKGCKEDAKNQPPLQDRLKEHRNKNPLPVVPPPKTKPQHEQ